jgi:hypothetical protein
MTQPEKQVRVDPIHFAAEMVAVQAHCTIEQALEMIRDRAAVQCQDVTEVAIGVLERRIRWSL